MKFLCINLFFTLLLVCVLISNAWAQQTEKGEQTSQLSRQNKKIHASNIYYGGELGLSFGDYFQISVIPMIGYKVTPKFSIGGKIGYSYTEDKRFKEKITSQNYGASIFSRYLLIASLYAHAEFVYFNYEFQTKQLESEREWVPFILLGGGYSLPISANISMFIEILWDVLQDENSPYDSTDAFVKIGVGIGF